MGHVMQGFFSQITSAMLDEGTIYCLVNGLKPFEDELKI